ncbi:MAG: hypothetical protein Kow001_14340 [Acidobacteriota bacterium]
MREIRRHSVGIDPFSHLPFTIEGQFKALCGDWHRQEHQNRDQDQGVEHRFHAPESTADPRGTPDGRLKSCRPATRVTRVDRVRLGGWDPRDPPGTANDGTLVRDDFNGIFFAMGLHGPVHILQPWLQRCLTFC